MNFTTPIEMPRGSHYGSEFYTVYSAKIGRVVNLFSKLEYYNFLSVETNPAVVTFCEQPHQIEFVEDGKTKKAIFDMWVRYKDGREEMQEVKYSKELSGDSKAAIRSQEQIRRQKRWCEENGIPLVVRTEEELIQGDYLIQNRNIIAGLVRRYIPADENYYNKLVIRYIEDAHYDGRKKILVNDILCKELLPISEEWAHLAYMHVSGVIELNIKSKPLDLRTEVKLVCQSK